MPTEADTCRTYIVAKLHAAGWEDDFIAEQRVIAPGRIVAYLDRLQAKIRCVEVVAGADAGTLRSRRAAAKGVPSVERLRGSCKRSHNGRAVIKNGTVMASKYTPLENYLRDLPESQREVSLGFQQIEKILNAKLPSSAYEDRRWWDNEKEGNHLKKRAWSNAGWKIESLDVNKKRVKLMRIR